MTLIEMLVVISIILILMAAAAPRFRTDSDTRRIREASRALNVYVSQARTRAITTRRPAGVWIQGNVSGGKASTIVSLLEVPPVYGGDTTSATATVTDNGTTLTAALTDCGQTLAIGDTIQFNYQGPWYEMTAVSGQSLTLKRIPGMLTPWGATASKPMPYSVRRQPAKGSGAPLMMSTGTVVDITSSGVGSGNFTAGDIKITFTPSGGVDRVINGSNTVRPTEAVYLLVGKREKVGAAGALTNLADTNNMWVAIQSQTGMIKTGQVAAGGDPRANVK